MNENKKTVCQDLRERRMWGLLITAERPLRQVVLFATSGVLSYRKEGSRIRKQESKAKERIENVRYRITHESNFKGRVREQKSVVQSSKHRNSVRNRITPRQRQQAQS